MSFSSTFDILYYQCKKKNQRIIISELKNGSWIDYRAEDCLKRIKDFQAILKSAAYKKGDLILIMPTMASPNSFLFDMAPK